MLVKEASKECEKGMHRQKEKGRKRRGNTQGFGGSVDRGACRVHTSH